MKMFFLKKITVLAVIFIEFTAHCTCWFTVRFSKMYKTPQITFFIHFVILRSKKGKNFLTFYREFFLLIEQKNLLIKVTLKHRWRYMKYFLAHCFIDIFTRCYRYGWANNRTYFFVTQLQRKCRRCIDFTDVENYEKYNIKHIIKHQSEIISPCKILQNRSEINLGYLADNNTFFF